MKTDFQRFFFVVGLFACGSLHLGCGPSASITGSWKSPDAAGAVYKKVLVAALSSDAFARQMVETELANRLQKKGIQATRSIDVFPPSFTRGQLPPREEIIPLIRKSGHDGVLTASLINSNTETRFVQGNLTYAPIGPHPYYGNFYGYYSRMYPMVYSPGYYKENNTYFLETNLYDVATEKLLWSAQSKAYDPPSLSDFSRDFARLTVGRLGKDGIF